jgi:hypothetical protein
MARSRSTKGMLKKMLTVGVPEDSTSIGKPVGARNPNREFSTRIAGKRFLE